MKKINKGMKAQGLVEYAITLALVAIAAIVALAILGTAVTRGYAIIAGVLGAQKSDSDAIHSPTDAIDISQADCDVSTSLNELQIVISINANVGMTSDDLSSSTPGGMLNTPFIADSGTPPTSFSQTTFIPGITDPGKCPTTVVVQGKTATSIKAVSVHLP